MPRTKNDCADAKLIAQFCRDIKLSLWQQSEGAIEELQAFTRRLEALEQMLTQEKNRLTISPEQFKGDIEVHIEVLEQQIAS